MEVPVLAAIEELRRDTGNVSYFFRRVIKDLRPLNLQDDVHYPSADDREGTTCVSTDGDAAPDAPPSGLPRMTGVGGCGLPVPPTVKSRNSVGWLSRCE